MKPEAAAFLNSLSATASSPSSSSRREHPDPNLADSSSKSAGCMSGILRLVSKYHPRNRRRRRFLTFRRPSIAENQQPIKASDTGGGGDHRSPTLPPEIRRSIESPRDSDCSVDDCNGRSVRNRQALVARLMGLDDGGGDRSVEAEQRRKLLGALEKCDEDLKVLKEMIEVVTKSFCDAKSRDAPAATAECCVFGAEKTEFETPSRSSPLAGSTRPSPGCGGGGGGGVLGIPRQQTKKPGRDHEEAIFLLDISATTKRQQPQAAISRAAAVIGHHHRNPIATPPPPPPVHRHRRRLSDVRAMEESVQKACDDIAWGQKREVGRIGLALHDHICKDLIDELVGEIVTWQYVDKHYYDVVSDDTSSCSSSIRHTLPFDSCKRSLRFR